jgi:hypothetical protein
MGDAPSLLSPPAGLELSIRTPLSPADFQGRWGSLKERCARSPLAARVC